MRMRGHPDARCVADFDNRGNFLWRHFRRSGYTSIGQHGIGGDHFEQIGASINSVLRSPAKFLGTSGYTKTKV